MSKLKKENIINDLRELYDNHSFNEKDECIILNTLTFLGFDIRLI